MLYYITISRILQVLSASHLTTPFRAPLSETENKKVQTLSVLFIFVVPKVGLEPTWFPARF